MCRNLLISSKDSQGICLESARFNLYNHLPNVITPTVFLKLCFIQFTMLLVVMTLAGMCYWSRLCSSWSENSVHITTVLLSLFCGAVLYWIPTIYMLCRVRLAKRSTPREFLIGFMQGQVGKFALNLVGFALVFSFVSPLVHLLIFFMYSVLIVAQSVLLGFWYKSPIVVSNH